MSLLQQPKPGTSTVPSPPDATDKLTAILEQLVTQSTQAGLSAAQLETILTKVGLSTAEGMRQSLKPENTEHRNESAYFTALDKQRYGSFDKKPVLTRRTFFVGCEEKNDRLTPSEIEGYNAITAYRTARQGQWKAEIKTNGAESELWVSVPFETVDQRMDLPSLVLILHELNGGPSTANLHTLVNQIAALKRLATTKGATAAELEHTWVAEA